MPTHKKKSRLRPLGAYRIVFLMGFVVGCDHDGSQPKGASPVVSVDSEAYRKAEEETRQKIEADRAAEAKARLRPKERPE
jgi:hypothetical protein